MKLLFPLFVLLQAAFYSIPIAAQVDDGRMKIGLVLSGGGARGGAHVGVLKVLEELQVPIDYIAGTSMGAIVGGLYASGYTADEIEQLLGVIDWDRALSDDPQRRDRTMRTKETEAEFLIPYRLGFNNGSFQMPLGAIEGQHLDQLFHRILLPVSQVHHFDDLPIPFRAVATDLETGGEVVLSQGNLSNAIRASMSVPGVFSPVTIGGRLLVDGGMVNNLPVSVAREMGADIIIAVDISTPLMTEEQLTSVLSVTMQLTGFLTRRNTERAIASLGDGDLLIVPELGDFSSADFADAVEIIGLGSEATLAQQDRLLALARPGHGPSTASESLTADNAGPPVVNFVKLVNNSALDDDLILSRLGVEPGDPLDIDALDRGVDSVYALDVFSSVTYDFIENEQGEDGVRINAMARRWGPNYLQFGLELAADSSGSDSFLMGGAYTRNAMNRLGGELRFVASVGREEELSLDLYQPIDFRANWFVEPEVYYRRTAYNLWAEDLQIAEFEVDGWGTRLALGRNFGTSDQFRLGYEFSRGDVDLKIGVPIFPLDNEAKIGEVVPEYRHDSLDSPWFPTSGMLHRLRYRYADDGLGASKDYGQAIASGQMAWTRGKNTLMWSYLAGYSFGDDAPLERWFRLGGFGRLSGLAPNQLTGRHVAASTLAAYRRLNEVKLLPAFGGATLELGNTWYLKDDIAFDDLRYAASLFVGAESPLGPLYFAVGYSDGGDAAVYFYIGNPWKSASFE